MACHHASCGERNWKKLAALGAAALNLVATDHLQTVHAHEEAGQMVQLKTQLINRSKCEQCARELGLERFIVVQAKFYGASASQVCRHLVLQAIVLTGSWQTNMKTANCLSRRMCDRFLCFLASKPPRLSAHF